MAVKITCQKIGWLILLAVVLRGWSGAGNIVFGQESEIAAENDNEEDDEDDLEVALANNPWGIDVPKFKAAKKYWFRKSYLLELHRIKSACQLNKKQALKLKIAAKGAAQKEFQIWWKDWAKQMAQFGNQGIGAGNGDEEADDDRRERKKELVVNSADEIDSQTMQYLASDQIFFGNFKEKTLDAEREFWRRTVRGVLTEQQRELYATYLAEQKQAQRDQKIDAFIAKMQLELAMTPEQTASYDALVRPSLKQAKYVPGYYESYIFQYYATKYDKKKMRQVLNQDQMQMMAMILGPSKTYAGMIDGAAAVADDDNSVFGSFMEGVVEEVFEAIADDVDQAIENVTRALGGK